MKVFRLGIISLLVSGVFAVHPLMAQVEVTPEPTPVVQPTEVPIPPDTSNLPAAPQTPAELIAIYVFFAGSVLSTLLVELLSKFITGVKVETLKQWVAVGLTAIFTVLVFTGNVSWFAKGSTVLQDALPYITGLIGALFGPMVARGAGDRVGIQLAR